MAEEKAKKPVNPALIQAIKAIAVLVVICLVCVLLLALCNDLLYIDDNTRLARAMKKIDPDFVLDHEIEIDPVTYSTGTVNKVYVSTDGAYIIEALGTGGYQGGSVTLYVVLNPDATIKAWAVKENDKQSYIDRIPSNAGKTWYVGKSITDDIAFDMTGATVKMTSTAIYNAVLTACQYAFNLFDVTDPVEEAKNAVLQLLGEDYSDYTLNRVNLGSATIDGKTQAVVALSDETHTLTYLFAGTGDNGTIFAYVYGQGANSTIVVVNDGVVLEPTDTTDIEDLVATILTYPFATFTYGNYSAYAVILDDGTSVYTVSGLAIGTMPKTYVLVITLRTNDDGVGEVVSIDYARDGETVIGNGFVPGDPSEGNANKLIDSLIGATSATIDGIYNDSTNGKVTGATQSANLIRAAVEAALNHYDAKLASND